MSTFYVSLFAIQEPVGVMVVEDMTVSLDEVGEAIFAFIIIYSSEPEQRHIFSCLSLSNAQQWVTALRQARFVQHSIQESFFLISILLHPALNTYEFK